MVTSSLPSHPPPLTELEAGGPEVAGAAALAPAEHAEAAEVAAVARGAGPRPAGPAVVEAGVGAPPVGGVAAGEGAVHRDVVLTPRAHLALPAVT